MDPPRRVWLALAAFLMVVLTACAPLPIRRTCPDGWPVKLLQDPTCRYGICGYTCAPDRWRA